MKGVYPLNYQAYNGGAWQQVASAITEEALACISVNGKELATFMCTPHDLDELTLGFLRSEGLISGVADVSALTLSKNETCVDVWLNHALDSLPARKIITSGCGGGITFDDLSQQYAPLQVSAHITPAQISARMRELYQSGQLYRLTQGIHTSALAENEKILLTAEDVGRHNTIDRLWGKALKQNLNTAGLILLATGRVSSEMLSKAVKMQVPIVISRTSPTSLSVALATAWNITLIGYARHDSFKIYTGAERLA